jgi:hypothetical protein
LAGYRLIAIPPRLLRYTLLQHGFKVCSDVLYNYLRVESHGFSPKWFARTYFSDTRLSTHLKHTQTIFTYDYTLGVPLTVSNHNDSSNNDTTISAEHDSFERITKLIRPGE